jgi:FlaA1/EpsC-like NDP-sugar epimerase
MKKFRYNILLKIILDIILVFLSLYFAISLNYEKIMPISKSYLILCILIIFTQTIIFTYNNVYSNFSRYLDIKNIENIFFSVSLTFVIFGLFNILDLDKFKYIFKFINLKILFFYTIIFIILNIFSKILIKFILYDIKFKYNKDIKNKTCAIYGAGSTGYEISNLIDREKYYKIKYFIDDDKKKIGRSINGIDIVDFEQLKSDEKIDIIFVCIPSISSFENQKIIKKIKKIKINYKIIPSFKNFFDGNVQNFFKNYSLSKNNILDESHANILYQKLRDKNILITGVAGSIGREIMFQMLKFPVKKVVGIDFNELGLSELKKDIENLTSSSKFNYDLLLANLCDKRRLEKIIEKNLPDIIYHAAAYKHVDIVEENPHVAVKNNIISIINIIDIIQQKNLKSQFIFISTDKAVNPINFMGMSKRIGEILTISMNVIQKNKNFTCVRFGNVIGSSGSLIPIINKQISNGGPITLTDVNATRYFMTIQDAVSLTIQSQIIGETGKINVLNMGKPINISDIINKILLQNNIKIKNNSNKNFNGIEIKITGLKPGEKLHEELFHNELTDANKNSKIFIERCNYHLNMEEVRKLENNLLNTNDLDEKKIRNYLNEIIVNAKKI